MTLSPPEKDQKVKVIVDNNPVATSFEKWTIPGHFDRTLSICHWQFNLYPKAYFSSCWLCKNYSQVN